MTEAEAAPHAVRAGNLVFCSGFTASNFTSGLAVGRRAGFPNYGNDAAYQAEHVFTTLNRVLAQAGTSLEEGLRLTVDWYRANREWWEPIKSGTYRAYYDEQYANRLKA